MTPRPIDTLPKVWDPDAAIGEMLKGKRGLVVGIANDQSIAYGCAMKLRAFGAELAVTWLNEKAEPYVRPLAEQLQASITAPLDVSKPGELEAVFEKIAKEWGRLDFVIHAIAFAPKDDLHGRVVDCSWEGFAQAMQVSCWSFIRMVKLAEPLMTEGGVLVTMSYYGADKVVNRYNMMGPVKASLEASVRYMAAELGPRGVRVFAVSPGPLKNSRRERDCPFRRACPDGAGAGACATFGGYRRGWPRGSFPGRRRLFGHDRRHHLR